MATICVSYLSFPGFDVDIAVTDIETLIQSGYYGFSDYAYAYWSRHLDVCLRMENSKESLREICEALEGFLESHWVEPQTRTVVPKSFLERWKQLTLNHDRDKLIVAGYLGYKQILASSKSNANDQVLILHNTIERIRSRLEGMWLANANNLTLKYGHHVFKCPHISCVHFYNGFTSKQERDSHVPRHERSFFCSFPGCPMSTLGCSTLRDLHKHETEYHSAFAIDDDEPEYPALPAEKSSFQCAQCNKKFTRNNNLKIHMRREHGGPNEQSFICSQCGRSFKRLGDRTRHESTIHSNAKDFACSGTLQNGSQWGCGRIFNRGDMLYRHWKSEKGMACIAPKQQEEASETLSTTGTD